MRICYAVIPTWRKRREISAKASTLSAFLVDNKIPQNIAVSEELLYEKNFLKKQQQSQYHDS